MNKKRFLSIGAACFGAFLLVMLIALTVHVPRVNSQGADESELEAAKALAAEEEEAQPGNIQVNPNIGFGGTYPLFAAVDDAAIPAVLIDPANNTNITAFVGEDVWGAAYAPDLNIVYFNSGTVLFEWPVGGSINMLGTMVNGSGAAQSLVSLAYYNGTLYGTKNIAPEAVHVINPATLIVTPTITYPTTHDMGGLSIDPDNGTIYATDDGSTDSLVIINPDGTVTPVAAYPTGETDIDGLAVGGGKAYMVTDDANGDIFVYNLITAAYETPLSAPWPTSETFSAGAWIDFAVAAPGIEIAKTVGTDPNSCAVSSEVTVPSGSDVTYCYEITNTGDVTLTVHDLDDSALGPILTGFPYTLIPAASAFLTLTTNIVTDTVNLATWVACNIDGPPNLTCSDTAAFDVVTATATATVTVIPPPPPMTPSISLTKTVGTTPGVCATTNSITVPGAGADVYYCYEVTNTGDVTLTLHDLVDSHLGSLITGLNFPLAPGDSVDTVAAGLTFSATITQTTVNTATWTAYNDSQTTASAAAGATVTVSDVPTSVSLTGFGEGAASMTPFLVAALLLLLAAFGLAMRRKFNG